jgi:hypothetical protein
MQKITISVIMSIVLAFGIIETMTINSNVFAQSNEYQSQEGQFTIEIPPNWEVVPKLNNPMMNSGFPYYAPATAVALKLQGIDAIDLDRHTYITITIQELEQYLDRTTLEVNTKTFDDVVQDEINMLETGILQDVSHEILNQNNTITLGGERAHQIQYITDIMGLNTFNVDTVAIHNDKKYKIHFNTGELMVPETLPAMNTIVNSFKFVNSSSIVNSTQPEESKQNIPQSSINNSGQTFPSTSLTSNNMDFTSPGPVAQIQQFNEDTGSGPVCCDTNGGASLNQPTGTTSPTASALADDIPETATTEEEENNDDNNRNNDDDEDENN